MAQASEFSFGQIPQLYGANCNAYESQDVHTDGLEQSADVAVLAFIQNNFQPAITSARSQQARPFCGEEIAGDFNALSKS